MKTVPISKYIEGIESIYEEQPSYEVGHDGSDGLCDCIGMCRGAGKRAGADPVNMRGTNQAARKAIQNLQELESSDQLLVGDVVLKVRDKDDKSMPLPDQYRKGGSEYDSEVGEINFTHIGTVTSIDPLVITHMTSPTAKKDKNIKGWSWFGELPFVEYEPTPEPEPEPNTAVVFAHSGSTVNMRRFPNVGAALVERVPIGSTVEILEYGNEWTKCKYKWFKGYMMTRFLIIDGDVPPIYYTVTIPGLTKDQAENLIDEYPSGIMTAG